eukprot:jgi/Botrbrau1/18405/Bobra.0869s0003.1
MDSPEGPPPPTGGAPAGKASADSSGQQQLVDVLGADMWPSAMIAVLLLLNLLRGVYTSSRQAFLC